MSTWLMPMTPRKFVWTTAVPFRVSFDPPAPMKNGCHRSVGDFGPVEEGAEGFCGFRLALGVRFGRCIFRHHQRRGIQGDLKSSAGSIHARVIDGHADCAYERHGDHRHQRGYTAPGVLEKTGQHRLTQRLLKTTYL
jgi:hypothetical protein